MNSPRKFFVLFVSLVIVIDLTGCSSLTHDDVNVSRDAVIGFGLMISKVTGRNPLDYCGYGNWCGKGGSGVPVDAIDNCCKIHDECYDRTQDKYKLCYPHLSLYTFSYDKTNNKISCNSLTDCGRDSCLCDSRVAFCFKQNEKYYDTKYKKSFWGQLVDCVS